MPEAHNSRCTGIPGTAEVEVDCDPQGAQGLQTGGLRQGRLKLRDTSILGRPPSGLVEVELLASEGVKERRSTDGLDQAGDRIQGGHSHIAVVNKDTGRDTREVPYQEGPRCHQYICRKHGHGAPLGNTIVVGQGFRVHRSTPGQKATKAIIVPAPGTSNGHRETQGSEERHNLPRHKAIKTLGAIHLYARKGGVSGTRLMEIQRHVMGDIFHTATRDATDNLRR